MRPLQRRRGASAGCRLLLLATLVLLCLTGPASPRALGAGDLGAWRATGAIATARAYHSDVLLPNGQVLIAGGVGASGAILSQAELYDTRASRWTPAEGMGAARAGVTAVLLRNGRVLMAGGASGAAGSGRVLASAEIYDPASGTWAAAGTMHSARYDYTATLLGSGAVLVAGGVGSSGAALASAELYDPAVGRWTATGGMGAARAAHTATLLPDGRVLVAGGAGGAFGSGAVLRSAELYNPSTGRWSATGSMLAGRAVHTATLLGGGRVLVAGGESGQLDGSGVIAGAELYDPRTGRWVVTGTMAQSRFNHTATLLPDGTVLVIGGQQESTDGRALSTAETYDPRTALWTPVGSMGTARTGHSATLLPDGTVLVAGGNRLTAAGPTLAGAEIYDPRAPRSTAPSDIGTTRAQFTATVLANGTVLVTGGIYAPPSRLARSSAELFNDRTAAWTPAGSMGESRASQTATLLPDGRVLVAGGFNSAGILDTAEIYDPQAGSWAPTGRLHVARAYHTATLLPDGRVLVAGGLGQTESSLASAELYDPHTGTWQLTGAMGTGRASQTATLLRDGRVLVAGGIGGKADRPLDSAEVYDPRLGSWAGTGRLSAARAGHTATALPNGQVLVVGGEHVLTPTPVLATGEAYDPRTMGWRAVATMSRQRVNHTATLLPDGRVLVVGGEDSSGADSNAVEIYSPAANTWAAARGSDAAHAYHVEAALPDGRVLIAGGLVAGFVVLSFSEVYSVQTDRWTATGEM